jgi:hypothetical protein
VFTRFWAIEPLAVRIFLLCLFTIAAVTALRFVRLAGHLYLHSGDSLLPEKFLKGEVGPDLFATYALANRPPPKVVLREPIEAESYIDRARANDMLAATESRFDYLCEKCSIDVEWAKRASWLAGLLSLVAVVYGATPAYLLTCGDGHVSGLTCLIESLDRLRKALALGLSSCVLLYLVSGFFEMKLRERRASWQLSFAGLRNQSSKE